MALSPTGIPLDWDCSALEALLAEDAGGEAVPTEQHLQIGAESQFHSPLYSPFSEGGSSTDSGFGAAGALLSEEDQLLAGLFGPNCPLLCDSVPDNPSLSSTVSNSITDSAATDASPPPSVAVVPSNSRSVTVLAPQKENRRMFESDDKFDTDSLSPLSVDSITTQNSIVGDQIDKNRKNADAARQNRLKKKKYTEDLEKDRSRLRADNVILKTKCTELQAKNRKLEGEVEYLRSVLANQSTLASLIKNIPGTPGVNLTTSFSRKRTIGTVDIATPTSASKRPRNDSESGSRMSGGVCLHVSKGNVSLEFCSQCSLNAAQT